MGSKLDFECNAESRTGEGDDERAGGGRSRCIGPTIEETARPVPEANVKLGW